MVKQVNGSGCNMLRIKHVLGEERKSCRNSVGKYLAKGSFARRSIREEQHTEVGIWDAVYEECAILQRLSIIFSVWAFAFCNLKACTCYLRLCLVKKTVTLRLFFNRRYKCRSKHWICMWIRLHTYVNDANSQVPRRYLMCTRCQNKFPARDICVSSYTLNDKLQTFPSAYSTAV